MPSADEAAAIAYYASKMVLQYRGKPRAKATIEILVKQAIADMFSNEVMEAYNIETAVGAQLDVIAQYIGVSRNSNVPTTVHFFGYADYAGGGSIYGYNDYAAALNGFIYDSYNGSDLPTTAFTDTQFRFVLKLQIALNHFDGTLAYIQNFLATFFPGQIFVVDNKDMSLTYNVVPGLPISNTLLENFLPRPMACGITVNTIGLSTTRVTTDGATRVTSGGATRITTA